MPSSSSCVISTRTEAFATDVGALFAASQLESWTSVSSQDVLQGNASFSRVYLSGSEKEVSLHRHRSVDHPEVRGGKIVTPPPRTPHGSVGEPLTFPSLPQTARTWHSRRPESDGSWESGSDPAQPWRKSGESATALPTPSGAPDRAVVAVDRFLSPTGALSRSCPSSSVESSFP